MCCAIAAVFLILHNLFCVRYCDVVHAAANLVINMWVPCSQTSAQVNNVNEAFSQRILRLCLLHLTHVPDTEHDTKMFKVCVAKILVSLSV